MTTRRRFLYAALAVAALPILTGCKNMSKQNIRTFGKTFDYLKDPALRQKETGDALLTVQNAEFSGEKFEGMEWRNIRFINCDFAGAYEIAPRKLIDSKFEDCRFAGILSYGVTENVQFLRCSWNGQSVMYGEKGSKNTLFQECQFAGPDEDRNHWGGVGTDGEAEFVKCKIKWFGLSGQVKLSIRDCEFEDAEIDTDSFGNSGENFLSSAVLIENSKLRGKFEIVSRKLQSLTIRNTVINHIDLSGTAVKDDVLMEGLDAGYINAALSARNFTIRKSTIKGIDNKVFSIGAAGTAQFLAEDMVFGRGAVEIGAGRPLEEHEWSIAPSNGITAFRNCKLPVLDASWLETMCLQFDKCEIQLADISNCRIGKLQIMTSRISEKIDLTNTRVQEQDLATMFIDKGRKEKLDGTNVKLPK